MSDNSRNIDGTEFKGIEGNAMTDTCHFANVVREFNIGDLVLLDKGTPCQHPVEIIHITKNKLFAHVKSHNTDYEWDVMTRRLSK